MPHAEHTASPNVVKAGAATAVPGHPIPDMFGWLSTDAANSVHVSQLDGQGSADGVSVMRAARVPLGGLLGMRHRVPYQAADQLAALKTGRMDGEGGWPWFVEGHVPEWLLPSMVWQGSTQPERCSRCDSSGWRPVDD